MTFPNLFTFLIIANLISIDYQGSFHTDGEGTILTTEECLLNKNRNKNMSKEEIERKILNYLGATKVIWLPFGLAFDEDTNGHVDNIACFARPGEVILSWTDDENDINRQRFEEAERVLIQEVDAKGRNLKINKLHIPSTMVSSRMVDEIQMITLLTDICFHHAGKFLTTKEVATLDPTSSHSDTQACERIVGERLAASYVNYYLSNEAIIVPQFGDKIYDKKAIENMEEIFPALKVVGVYSREILIGGGNIHCVTQQFPLSPEDLKCNN